VQSTSAVHSGVGPGSGGGISVVQPTSTAIAIAHAVRTSRYIVVFESCLMVFVAPGADSTPLGSRR